MSCDNPFEALALLHRAAGTVHGKTWPVTSAALALVHVHETLLA